MGSNTSACTEIKVDEEKMVFEGLGKEIDLLSKDCIHERRYASPIYFVARLYSRAGHTDKCFATLNASKRYVIEQAMSAGQPVIGEVIAFYQLPSDCDVVYTFDSAQFSEDDDEGI